MRNKRGAGQVPWLLPLPIMQAMYGVDGFLFDEEADLLLAATVRMLSTPGLPRVVVEVGSYCGKSTVVFGLVAKALDPEARVYAIDPHEGDLSSGEEIIRVAPTFERFQRTMTETGLDEVVVPIRMRSTEVPWDSPIGMLFIDGLHDYENVSRDFAHLADWVAPGGLVVFHDYDKWDFPGITTFVDEVVAGGGYRLVQRAGSVAVLEKADSRRRILGVLVAAHPWFARNNPALAWQKWQSARQQRRERRIICVTENAPTCPERDISN